MAFSPAGLAALFDEHAGGLYRYAVVILADPAAAEDAVQEAFVRLAIVLDRRPRFQPTIPYLRTIVRNECYSLLRKRRRLAGTPASGALLERVSPEATEEERLLLESALRVLPPEQREVVYLKVFEGLTFDEIATATGVPLNTAASRYRYAMDALRKVLGVRLVTHQGKT